MQVNFKFAIDDVVVNRFGEIGIVKMLCLNMTDINIGVRYKDKTRVRWEDDNDLRNATKDELKSLSWKGTE